MFIPMFFPFQIFFSLTVVACFIHWRLKDHNSNCPMCYSHIFPLFYPLFEKVSGVQSDDDPSGYPQNHPQLDPSWIFHEINLIFSDVWRIFTWIFHERNHENPWPFWGQFVLEIHRSHPWRSKGLAKPEPRHGSGQVSEPPERPASRWMSVAVATAILQRGSRKNMGRCSENVGNMWEKHGKIWGKLEKGFGLEKWMRFHWNWSFGCHFCESQPLFDEHGSIS